MQKKGANFCLRDGYHRKGE
ncbi:MAG: hypothetical protein N1989_08220 [Escherichia coli]